MKKTVLGEIPEWHSLIYCTIMCSNTFVKYSDFFHVRVHFTLKGILAYIALQIRFLPQLLKFHLFLNIKKILASRIIKPSLNATNHRHKGC